MRWVWCVGHQVVEHALLMCFRMEMLGSAEFGFDLFISDSEEKEKMCFMFDRLSCMKIVIVFVRFLARSWQKGVGSQQVHGSKGKSNSLQPHQN